MHASRGRGHARVLYWFRTPPNVRVGRAALDEDAIRAIEASNPDIEFDWTRMLKERAVAPISAERSTRDRRDRDSGRPAKAWRSRPSTAAVSPAGPPPEGGPDTKRGIADAGTLGGPIEHGASGVEETLPADTAPEPATLPPGLHVEERLGTEGFSRLRARYAELLARISERVTDPARLEELRAQAERLNPDTWITDAEARAGIEGFDSAYDALRARLGRRKRRSRRGARRRRSKTMGHPGGMSTGLPGTEPGTGGAEPEVGDASDQGGEPDEPEPSA